VFDFTNEITEDIELEAEWTENEYTVVFDANE
jgi:hypothetical protein